MAAACPEAREEVYRDAALESRTQGFANVVVIRGSLSASILTVLALCIFATVVAYGSFAQYGKTRTVTGYLAPQTGFVSMSAPAAGQLILLVEDGAEVEKGELLARIVTQRQDVQSRFPQELRDRYINDRLALLARRRGLVEAELGALEERRVLQQETLARRVESLETRGALLDEELTSLMEQFGVQNTLFERGQASRSQLNAAHRTTLEMERSAMEAREELDQARADLNALDVTFRELRLAREREFNEISLQERELRFDLQAAIADAEIGLFAPTAGRVSFAQATDSDYYFAGALLLRIFPAGVPFKAVAFVPPDAIHGVALGDTLALRYEAYPHHVHGSFHGVVSHIDIAPLRRSEINAPIDFDESAYRVELTVDQAPLNKSGRPLSLTSGFTFEVDIVQERMSIVRWLFYRD
ncbi:MAG: hypothetical protein CVT80_00080 [Alphaproteobacteria bacterium HGW-Alphaproteobacteria-2]|nr:MAG: hypothetical protein CVT80_00080 [Alphaproteobacteria bacterium HGW-Alphaproteobacteria-2]